MSGMDQNRRARELYQQAAQGRIELGSFYAAYLEAVLQELRSDGRCEFLQTRLQELGRENAARNLQVFNLAECLAYQNLRRACRDGRLPNRETAFPIPDRLVIEDVTEVSWEELNRRRYAYINPVNGGGELRRRMVEDIQVLNGIAAQEKSRRQIPIQDGPAPETRERGPEPETEDRKQTGGETRWPVFRAASQKPEAAPPQEELLKKARQEAEAIRQQAEEERQRLLEEARQEAAKLREQARQESREIVDQARELGEELRSRAEQEARERAEDLTRQVLADRLGAGQEQLRRQLEAGDAADRDRLIRSEQEREAIWGRVSGMQGDLVQAMEDAVAQVTRIKQDLCQELGQWRGSLHINQYDNLVKVFAGLFRLHNELNRLVAAVTAAGLPEQSAGEAEDAFRRLDASLSMLERQMERGLGVFGMHPIRPAAGEGFDPELHELTDQQQEDGVPAREGSPIRRCVAPGVALSYREELRDDTILRRAKVEVEPGGQG